MEEKNSNHSMVLLVIAMMTVAASTQSTAVYMSPLDEEPGKIVYMHISIATIIIIHQ